MPHKHNAAQSEYDRGAALVSSPGPLKSGHPGDAMSKSGNEANNVFRPSDRPLTEHEKEQIAQRKNLERLKAERLAREASGTPKKGK